MVSHFGNADEDLRNIQARLKKDALTNYVATELLPAILSVEISEASITDTEIKAKIALGGEMAAVEVTFTCNTTILADASEITQPVRVTALLTVDHYDQPTGGEITSIHTLEDDSSFDPWKALAAADANGDQMTPWTYQRRAVATEETSELASNPCTSLQERW